jgi:hypothetical protein
MSGNVTTKSPPGQKNPVVVPSVAQAELIDQVACLHLTDRDRSPGLHITSSPGDERSRCTHFGQKYLLIAKIFASWKIRRSVSPYYSGAGERTRTSDLLITNQLLYHLSYTGIGGGV